MRDLKRVLGMLHGYKAFAGPKDVSVDITNECDLHCIMCLRYGQLAKNKADDETWRFNLMKYGTFSSLLSELTKIGTDSITIGGAGEAFLHPDIKKMLLLLGGYPIRVRIISNGIHIDKEMLDYMVKFKVEYLTLSIHAGNRQTFKLIHPLENEELFDAIQEKLMYLQMRKKDTRSQYPKVNIINVISCLNCDNIIGMFKFAKLIGAERIFYRELIVTEEIKDLLSLRSQHINKIKKDAEALRGQIQPEQNIDEFLDVLNRRMSGTVRLIKNRFCYVPWTKSNITTEGKVMGCLYTKNSPLGDITVDSFRKIWEGREYAKFRKGKFCMENCYGASVYPFVNFINKINRIKNRFCAEAGKAIYET